MMSDLSDYIRIVHNPLVKSLKDKIKTLEAERDKLQRGCDLQTRRKNEWFDEAARRGARATAAEAARDQAIKERDRIVEAAHLYLMEGAPLKANLVSALADVSGDAQFECGCWYSKVGVLRHPAITGVMCCPVHRKPYKVVGND